MSVTFDEFMNRVSEDCKQQLIERISKLEHLDQETTDAILNFIEIQQKRLDDVESFRRDKSFLKGMLSEIAAYSRDIANLRKGWFDNPGPNYVKGRQFMYGLLLAYNLI